MRPVSRRAARAAAVLLLASAAAAPAAHAACCYFAAKDKDINQPGQKAFITWSPEEKLESFTVQPKFEGNAVDFGMVIPTPSQPKLDEMPRDLFRDLAIYTILMPLPQTIYPGLGYAPDINGAIGAWGSGPILSGARDKPKDDGVKVVAAGVVGSLDYKVIVAEKADGLYDWLKENDYSCGGDSATLDFYIKKKWFFTVMKIDPKAMKKKTDGSYEGEVTPTRFTFQTEKCIYPLKITQLSVKDATDALFYVHAKNQMDLEGELSFMHSYRVMYLTYMLGCGASEQQRQELQARNEWIKKKKAADPKLETTKLEWARKLGDAEIVVLENPHAAYAQGGNVVPDGASVISRDDFLKEVREKYDNERKNGKWDEKAKERLKQLEEALQPEKGAIVKTTAPLSYKWYPNREAPWDDVTGLSRLKGHLKRGKWLTKIRKHIRKEEMSEDLVFVPVAAGKEQDYARIMPTSPP